MSKYNVKSYYGIFQYYPKKYKKEVCNIGILLYNVANSPSILTKVSKNPSRINKFFDLKLSEKDLKEITNKINHKCNKFISYIWELFEYRCLQDLYEDINKMYFGEHIKLTELKSVDIADNFGNDFETDCDITLKELYKEYITE